MKARLTALLLALALAFAPALAANEGKFIFGMVYRQNASLNPLLCTQRDLQSLNRLVFEGVMCLDGSLEPQCELALKFEQPENGPMNVFDFTLRDNVQFHDGTLLCAQDVYATYDYIKAIGSSCPYYARIAYIESMEVLDTCKLRVTGKYASYLTLYAMTFPVLQRSSLGLDMAIGTGPYWYIARDEDWIQLDVNPFWWKKAATVDTVYAFRYDETGDALKALTSGEVDAFATRSQTAALGRLLNDRVSVDYTTTTYEMLMPNISKSIFSDVRTRQALMYAIDISTMAKNIYMDMVTESEVPVVTGSWLYEPQSAVYFYSLERAYQLLKEAGWIDYNEDGILDRVEDGVLVQFEFKLYTYTDDAAGTRTHAAELIRDQLARLGISVEVVTTTKTNVEKRLKSGDFDLILCAVNLSELPDLTFLLNSDGRMNYSHYASGTMNQLLQSIYGASKRDDFKLAFSDLQKKVAEELPFLGLFFKKGTLMTKANVTGLDAAIEGDVLRGFESIEFNEN